MNYMINKKFLSLPPYISTSWDQIKAIRYQDSILIIDLVQNTSLSIPDLSHALVESIFVAHADFLQNEGKVAAQVSEGPQIQLASLLHSEEGNPAFEHFNTSMQHNPEMAHLPDFPEEVRNKIAAVAKVLIPHESPTLPQPEPHCNCPHCQIARAIHLGLETGTKLESVLSEEVVEIEELVDDEDLRFEQWQIESKGNHLYLVSNKLDLDEQYSVFLGDPVGCNCGKIGCEHILAVLNS